MALLSMLVNVLKLFQYSSYCVQQRISFWKSRSLPLKGENQRRILFFKSDTFVDVVLLKSP